MRLLKDDPRFRLGLRGGLPRERQSGLRPKRSAVRDVGVDHLQGAFLMVPQFHSQHDLGEICGGLEIDTSPFGPHELSYVRYASRSDCSRRFWRLASKRPRAGMPSPCQILAQAGRHRLPLNRTSNTTGGAAGDKRMVSDG